VLSRCLLGPENSEFISISEIGNMLKVTCVSYIDFPGLAV
jgi:hypothetical protein